jgi:hypothetical protein
MTTSASGTTLVQHGACSLPVASDLDASTDDDDAGDDAGAKPPTHEPPAIEAIALARDEAGVGAVYALSKNTLFRFDAQCANPRPIPLPSGEQYTRLFAVDGRVAVGADRALILGKLEAGAMRALVSVSLEQRLSDAKYLPKHDAWFVRHTGPTRGCSVLDARAAADGAAMRLLQDTTCSEPMDSVEAVLVTTAADATRKPALVRIDVRVGSNELELPGKVWASGLDAGASRVFAALASGDVSIVTLATWCSALTPAIDISAMAESMRPK